ncbi:hypothetical protein MMC25_007105 [Agyrium rufum]|nr:hypothetical protein [Agyrium rufum]
MKRRRQSREQSLSSSHDSVPTKKRQEYMSHVEVPHRPSSTDVPYFNTPDKVAIATPKSGTMDSNLEAGVASRKASQPSQPRRPLRFAPNLDLEKLSETIQTQFNLEILLKHRELRLIDQEIAKCQVALEQLRRCLVIPYPSQSTAIEDMQNVASGMGEALSSDTQSAPPTDLAPWGVTEGPYSRHYSQWLLPDPKFDGGFISTTTTSYPPAILKPIDKGTRGSKTAKATTSLPVRSSRGSTTRLQALPAGYPEPKHDKGPMIVKRSTDGAMVKLVCLDCRREDFNSTQGFINHCRIAHSRGFASHDAAAIACGEEVELNEVGLVKSDTSAVSNAGLVHPLIRSIHLIDQRRAAQPIPSNKRKRDTKSNTAIISTPRLQKSSQDLQHRSQALNTSSPFIPSINTPYLSNLFALSGRGGDLDSLVRDVTTKERILESSPSSNEDEVIGNDYEDVDMTDPGTDGEQTVPNPTLQTPKTQSHTKPAHLRAGRTIFRATMSPAPPSRPPSRKALDRHTNTNTITPIPGARGGNRTSRQKPPHLEPISSSISTSAIQDYAHSPSSPNHRPLIQSDSHMSDLNPTIIMLDSSPNTDLSPATVESHQPPAPSLTSDSENDVADESSESDALSSEPADEDDGGKPPRVGGNDDSGGEVDVDMDIDIGVGVETANDDDDEDDDDDDDDDDDGAATDRHNDVHPDPSLPSTRSSSTTTKTSAIKNKKVVVSKRAGILRTPSTRARSATESDAQVAVDKPGDNEADEHADAEDELGETRARGKGSTRGRGRRVSFREPGKKKGGRGKKGGR